MLSWVEEQILLWVKAYPGLSRLDLEEKHLDCDIAVRIREVINSLKGKGHIADRDDELVATNIMEIP